MTETIQVGSEVADFSLDAYDPKSGDFTTVSLADNRANGAWTILVFYPADFTFV